MPLLALAVLRAFIIKRHGCRSSGHTAGDLASVPLDSSAPPCLRVLLRQSRLRLGSAYHGEELYAGFMRRSYRPSAQIHMQHKSTFAGCS